MTKQYFLTLIFVAILPHSSRGMRPSQTVVRSAKNALAATAHYVPNAAPLVRHITHSKRLIGQHADGIKDNVNEQPKLNTPKLLDLVPTAEQNAENSSLHNQNSLNVLRVGAQQGNSEYMQGLINSKANIHATDEDGHNTLHIAALCHNTEAMTALLQNGALVDQKSNIGATALTMAIISCVGYCDEDFAVALAVALNASYEIGEITPTATQLLRSNKTICTLLDAGASLVNVDLPRVIDALLEESEDDIKAFHRRNHWPKVTLK